MVLTSVRWNGVVPLYTRAAGVSGFIPASMRCFEMRGRFFMPMTNTSVEALRARLGQSRELSFLSGFSWPVTMVTEEEKSLWVSGMPA